MEPPAHYAFLHGGGQGSWVWDDTVAALQRQTDGQFGTALQLDVPGCGTKRGRDTGDLDLDDVVGELLADLDRAAMRDVVLVGHSQAGNLMPALAQRRPQLFRRLIYVSCSIPLPGQTVLQMMGSGPHGRDPGEVGWPDQWQESADGHRQHLRDDRDPAASKRDRDAWPMRLYAYTGWRFQKPASVPATYVFCLRDRMLPMNWQRVFSQRLDAGRHVHLDCGHQAMSSRPQALAEILRREAREEHAPQIAV